MTAPTVIGKYQLLRKLATGGMAEVYLARVAGPGGFEKTVVLKRILPHLAEDASFVDMFLSEAKLAAQLNHPNVVQIFDFGQEQDLYLLVMEYLDGPNLRSLYRRALELNTPIGFALAAKIISFACEGLAYAHDFVDPATGEPMGLVHRDISPDNIIVTRNGGVKVVDFGIAKAANQSHHTKTGTIKGKFAYMPPEQLKGLQLDRRSDIFALGIVLYELVTGVKPFDTTTDAQILQAILYEPMRPAALARPDTPAALQAIIDQALEKNRDRRYADCRLMQQDLERFIVSLGEPVGQFQVAQLVQRLAGPAQAIPPSATPAPRPSAVGMLVQATPEPSSPQLLGMPPPPPMPTAVTTPVGIQAPLALPGPAAVAPSPSASAPIPASALVKRKGGLPAWAGVMGVGVLLLAAGAWVALRPVSGQGQPAAVALDAGAVAAVTPPAVAPPVVNLAAKAADSGQVAEAAPDAGTQVAIAPPDPPVVDPGPKPKPKPKPGKPARPPKPTRSPPAVAATPTATPTTPERTVETGTVEFRVRPYASVLVNGRPYGDTPFGEIVLPVGPVTVKLVNKDLGKEVTVPFEVKPGKNTFKYNLEE